MKLCGTDEFISRVAACQTRIGSPSFPKCFRCASHKAPRRACGLLAHGVGNSGHARLYRIDNLDVGLGPTASRDIGGHRSVFALMACLRSAARKRQVTCWGAARLTWPMTRSAGVIRHGWPHANQNRPLPGQKVTFFDRRGITKKNPASEATRAGLSPVIRDPYASRYRPPAEQIGRSPRRLQSGETSLGGARYR